MAWWRGLNPRRSNAPLSPPEWLLESCIKMGSDESHFHVLLITRDRVTRQCPQTTTFKEKGEPKRNQTEVLLLTSLYIYKTRYRLAKPPSPPTSIPLPPPFFPSLISRTVSVDVKHHAYLLGQTGSRLDTLCVGDSFILLYCMKWKNNKGEREGGGGVI